MINEGEPIAEDPAIERLHTPCALAVTGLLVGGCAADRDVASRDRLGRTFAIQEGPPLPLSRGGHAAGLVADHLVVAGGNTWSPDRLTKQWLADSLILRDGAWQAGPPLPSPRAYTAFAQSGGALYLAGGLNPDGMLSEVLKLSTVSATGQWEKLPALPMALNAGAAVVTSGRLYVMCGESKAGLLNRMWSLPLDASQSWREEPPLPGAARAFPAAVSTRGTIVVLGGASSWSPLTPLADAWSFDTKTSRWKQLPDLSNSGYAWSAAMMGEDQVVLAGQADGEIHDDIWQVDLPSMHTGKLGDAVIQTTTAPLVRIADNEWWLIAGEPDGKKTRTNRVSRIVSAPGRASN